MATPLPAPRRQPAKTLGRVRQDLVDLYPDETMVFADGYDDAIMGVVAGNDGLVVIYDIASCIGILMVRDKMSEDEAAEFLEFNVIGAYIGPQTPIFMHTTHLPYLLYSSAKEDHSEADNTTPPTDGSQPGD